MSSRLDDTGARVWGTKRLWRASTALVPGPTGRPTWHRPVGSWQIRRQENRDLAPVLAGHTLQGAGAVGAQGLTRKGPSGERREDVAPGGRRAVPTGGAGRACADVSELGCPCCCGAACVWGAEFGKRGERRKQGTESHVDTAFGNTERQACAGTPG